MRTLFYQVVLKTVAIIRRVFEPCFREMQEGWQDLDDIATWENVRLFPLETIDETVLHFPICEKRRKSVFNAPFAPVDVGYFLKCLDRGRMCEEYVRFWTTYFTGRGDIVTEYNMLPVGSRFHTVLWFCIVEDKRGYGLCTLNFEGWFSSRQEALNKLVSLYGVDNQPNVIVKYKTWR